MLRTAIVLVALGATSVAHGRDCVVLLHGLLRTASSMETMAEALSEAGYEVANVDYPSREHPIERLAPLAVESGVAQCRSRPDADKIHFVTHSLGGILLRYYLAEKPISDLGRVVMLGPPNQGSAAVDELGDVPGFDWLNGPAGRQLGQGPGSIPRSLGPADFELGVIAGTRSIDPLTSSVLENPDDGRVSVEDTKVAGMDDFALVSHSHAFMMRMRRPIELTLNFLESGSFSGTKVPPARLN